MKDFYLTFTSGIMFSHTMVVGISKINLGFCDNISLAHNLAQLFAAGKSEK